MSRPVLEAKLRIEAVVFDCGDTLLELEPSKVEVCHGVLAEMGLAVSSERVRRAYEIADFQLKQRSSQLATPNDRRKFFSHFNGLLAEILGIETLAAHFDEELQAAFERKRHWRAMTGVREALAAIGARVPLFVFANWDSRLNEHLERNGLLSSFRLTVASQTVGAEKPQEVAFRRFAELADITPASSIYVGNEYRADVIGSRRVGFTPVLLDVEGRYGPEVDCLYSRDWSDLQNIIEACLDA